MSYYDTFMNVNKHPAQRWRNQLQDTVDKVFENASTWWDDVWEEKEFGSNGLETITTDEEKRDELFNKIDIRITSLVDAKTGQRVNDDYKKLIYKDLDYRPKLGQRYFFDDNIWIIYSRDNIRKSSSSAYVRRCNNTINTLAEDEKTIHREPCYIEYKIIEDQISTSEVIDVPKDKIEVVCQYNDWTSQYRINTRFMLNGVTYKIRQFVNFLNMNTFQDNPGLLKFYADFENYNVADNPKNDLANDDKEPKEPEEFTILLNGSKTFVLDGDNYTFECNKDKTVSEDYYSFTFTNNSFKIKNHHQSTNPLIVNCYQDGILIETFNIKLGGVV